MLHICIFECKKARHTMFFQVVRLILSHLSLSLAEIWMQYSRIHSLRTASIAKPISYFSLRYRSLILPYKLHLHSFCPFTQSDTLTSHCPWTSQLTTFYIVHRGGGQANVAILVSYDKYEQAQKTLQWNSHPPLTFTVNHCDSHSHWLSLSVTMTQSPPWGGRDVVYNMCDYI
jgi:hypothetical protein